MRTRICVAAALAAAVLCLAEAQAQDPGKLNLEAAELRAARLMNAPVFAGDTEIGVVADVSMREDGRIDRLRVLIASPLGLGGRVVEIPEAAIALLKEVVVLDLTAEEVDQFPTRADGEQAIDFEER